MEEPLTRSPSFQWPSWCPDARDRTEGDLAVTREGYRSAVLRNVRTPLTVVLRAAKPLTVRIRFAEGSPFPVPPFHVEAHLAWAEDEKWRGGDSRDAHGNAKFGRDRVVMLKTYDPGRYVVRLTLWEAEMRSASGSRVSSVPERPVVTVPQTGGPVEIVVGVDPEELREQTQRK